MLRKLVTTFFTGFFALLPLLITIGVVGFLVGKLNAWLGPGSSFGKSLSHFPQHLAVSYLASLTLVILFILLIGFFVRRVTGKRVVSMLDGLIGRIPLINKVYKSVEQIIGLMNKQGGSDGAALSNVVMAKIANMRVLGLLASTEPVTIDGVAHFLIYLPSTPIPASGQNLLVPCSDVEDVDVSVEELTKILLSLGSLGPGIMNAKAKLVLPALKEPALPVAGM